MSHLFAAVSSFGPATQLLSAPSPTPFPDYQGDPNLITPGVIGFIAIFVIAVATVFLLIDMNRRIRRSRYREQVRDELAAEDADALARDDRRVGRDQEDSDPVA